MNWTLFYDGGCNLCHRNQLRAERWAKRSGQPLRATPIQSDEGIAKGYGLEGMVLEVGESTFIGALAWLELMKIAPWYLRWIYPIRQFFLVRLFFQLGYAIVARIRYRVFGTRQCKI